MGHGATASKPTKAGGAELRVTVQSHPPDWGGFLARRDDATIYHDPRWGRVMQRAYGNRPYYLTAIRGERVVGALQLVLQRSVLFGCRLCSLPYFDAAGVLADDPGAEAALLAEAEALRRRCGAEHVELRQTAPLGPSLPTRTDKVTMWLPLAGDADAVWQQLKTKVRTKVRKAGKRDLDIRCGGAELLDAFHVVYARTMRDLGSPSHGRRFFEILAREFGHSVRIFVTYAGPTPAAASLCLFDGETFRVPWSGSDYRLRKLSANRVLYWEMLSYAADRGAARFDFGRSSRGSGTHQFKREWGAEPVPLYWHFLLPGASAPPELRPDSAKYRLLVAAWRKLPVPAAAALGPRLIARLS